jgi:tyrosyl-tRNA synthetase
VAACVGAGLAASNSEARRLIQAGGVSIDGRRLEDPQERLGPGNYLLKVGKRRFKRIRVVAK